MLLELTHDTTTSDRSMPPTGPINSPSIVKPSVVHSVVGTEAQQTSGSDPERVFDGIRILGDLAPLERARLYRHSIESRLEVLQSWEGAVTHIDHEEGFFTARLCDLTNPNAAISEADFVITDVSEDDRDLLRIGSIFRWMVGYRRYSFGKRERVSAIVFRRLPAWSETDLKAAEDEGARLAAGIVVE